MSKRNRQPPPVLSEPADETAAVAELEPNRLPDSPLVPEEAVDPLAPPLPPVPEPEPAEAPCCPGTTCRRVTLELPLAPLSGYAGNHLDLRLGRVEAELLARLRRGLNEGNHRLAAGKHVASANDAVRWLLEQCVLAAAREEAGS